MKAAIFDMDGLLFDTEKVFQETWNELSCEITGKMLPEEFKYRICGVSGEPAYRIVEEFFHLDDGEPVAWECYRRVEDKVRRHIDKKPGCDEILRFFRDRGIRMAVASSSREELIMSNMKLSGLEPYFDAFVSGMNLEHGKPAPDIFLLAAKEIDVPPEECFVFEDSISGIRAGHAAGMKPVMIPDLLQPDPETRSLCFAVYDSLLAAAEALGAYV